MQNSHMKLGVKPIVTASVVHSVESTEIMEWESGSATGALRLTQWELALRNGKNQAGMA